MPVLLNFTRTVFLICGVICIVSCSPEKAANSPSSTSSANSDKVEAPTASPDSGMYSSAQSVTLVSATPGYHRLPIERKAEA